MNENVEVKIEDVLKVREATGYGMMDCKKALLNNNNNIELSIKYLTDLENSEFSNLGVLVTRRKF